MIICNLKMLLSKPGIFIPSEDTAGYTLMAAFDENAPNMDVYLQTMSLFDWLDMSDDKPVKKYIPISDENGAPNKLQGLYFRSDLPIGVLGILNTITEVMSALDLSKLHSDIDRLSVGDTVFMSGMYSTIIDQLISAHKNHSLKFKKVTDKIQGLTNITFPMTVTSLEGGNIVLNIVPYLLPVIPVADMTLPMSKMDALRPYFKILE